MHMRPWHTCRDCGSSEACLGPARCFLIRSRLSLVGIFKPRGRCIWWRLNGDEGEDKGINKRYMCIITISAGQFSTIDVNCSACLLQKEATSWAVILEFQSSLASNHKSAYGLTKGMEIMIASFVSPSMKWWAFKLRQSLDKRTDNFTEMDWIIKKS